jgi:hypothetical protein
MEGEMKDAVATMGNLLPDDSGGRDAVHVAVFSARSPVRVFPGQHVGLVDNEPVEHGDTVVSPLAPLIGIVDPFLAEQATPGERFWVYLYPRTITALSHRWGHPAFGEAATAYASPSATIASEKWLREFCEYSGGPSYDMAINAASQRADGDVGYGDEIYLHIDGDDASGEIPPEFWDHIAVVLGRPIKGPKATYFSCSC